MESCILWKFFALSFVVVLILGGCESTQTTNTAPTVVSVGTVYAKMTVTAVAEATQTTSARGRESEPSRTAAAPTPSLSTEEFLKQHRETFNPDKVLVPSCFPNCPTQVPTPQEIAREAAKNPTPIPTVVWKTYSGTHAGIKANEAIALVKDYLSKKPYPGDTRVYQGETCGWIWDRDTYSWKGKTTWTARRFGDSAWMVWAQNSGLLDWVESGWVVYPAFGSILSAGTVYDIDPEIVAKRC